MKWLNFKGPYLNVLLAATAIGVFWGVLAAHGQPISVRGDRWLAVSAVTGNVEIRTQLGHKAKPDWAIA